MMDGMILVEVRPGDVFLHYQECPHCHQGFGKGDRPELVYEARNSQAAIHYGCVLELVDMPLPDEVSKRRQRARRRLLADRRALRVESGRERPTRAG